MKTGVSLNIDFNPIQDLFDGLNLMDWYQPPIVLLPLI